MSLKVARLFGAIERGNTKLVESLIQDVNVNSYLSLNNNTDATPLMLATFKRNIDIMQLLLNKGANVDAQSPQGFTALMLLCTASNLRNDALTECNHAARLLLTKGADVNHTNMFGTTPLMFSAHRGVYELVTTLIDSGADTHTTDDKGISARGYASLGEKSYKGQHEQVIRLLDRLTRHSIAV